MYVMKDQRKTTKDSKNSSMKPVSEQAIEFLITSGQAKDRNEAKEIQDKLIYEAFG